MSLWQFQAGVNGYIESQSPSSDGDLDSQDIQELSELIEIS